MKAGITFAHKPPDVIEWLAGVEHLALFPLQINLVQQIQLLAM